jgi:acylphosphatase
VTTNARRGAIGWASVDEANPRAGERREVYFSGRVQGVGFRYTTRDIASRFPVVGFVQNLSDGRVLLVVEGQTTAVDRFLAAIADEMNRFISDSQVRVLACAGEFSTFEIKP